MGQLRYAELTQPVNEPIPHNQIQPIASEPANNWGLNQPISRVIQATVILQLIPTDIDGIQQRLID